MASSSSSTRLASCSSLSRTEWTDWWTARSPRLPIQSKRSLSSFRSFSKWRSICSSVLDDSETTNVPSDESDCQNAAAPGRFETLGKQVPSLHPSQSLEDPVSAEAASDV